MSVGLQMGNDMLWSGLSREMLISLIEFCLEGDKSPKTAHITRLFMYNKLRNCLSHLDAADTSVLSISGSGALIDVLGLKQATKIEAAYPEYSMLDFSAFAAESFDIAVSDQVLEHVEGDPFHAIQEVVRVLKIGGFVVHTTCFLNGIHGAPNDFWRFSEDSLKLLMQSSNCDLVESGSWGNREAWAYIDLGFRLRPIPDNPQNPVYRLAMLNEGAWFPIVTWVVGRKRPSRIHRELSIDQTHTLR
jgi:SAM-dependent methyltransferase